MKQMKMVMTLMVLLMVPSVMRAQFTVVDEDTREPLPGVYVFSSNGTLLTMSDENGVVKPQQGIVTLSMMTYESKTVDGSTQSGEVTLKTIPHELGEVVVGKTEFIKVSAVFRGILKNYDNVVIFREGIVDYYYDCESKKHTRRVRACRQYEHPELRSFTNDSIGVLWFKLLDFDNIGQLSATGDSIAHGDTLVVGASYGKVAANDGVMIIKKNGLYRSVIDNLKFSKRTSASALGFHLDYKKFIGDWTRNSESRILDSFVAYRGYTELDVQWSKKRPVIPMQDQQDVIVTGVTYLSKKDAKAEMKNKDIVKDFTLPAVLPAVPELVADQVKRLVLKKFRER